MGKELEQEKVKFFNLYRGQEVFYLQGLGKLKFEPDQQILEGDCVCLKPLSLISEEDAIIVAKLQNWKESDMNLIPKSIRFLFQDNDIYWLLPSSFQHLIQSGYAVDYYASALRRVIKVEEQVSLGWIKLKEV